MCEIITAIAEENILKIIIKNKIIENKNILYKEAVLDIIKKNKNIKTIIISEKIPGEIEFRKLIKKIKNINKNINIIVIASNKKKKKELEKNNIENIYYNNIWNIYKLINKLKQEKEQNKILSKKRKINKKIYKSIYVIKKWIQLRKNNYMENKNNVIFLFGENKIDKNIVRLLIIKKLIIKNKKIILLNLKNHDIKEKNKNNKIEKLNKIKNKYYLKIDYHLKEKIINKNMKQIININNILKNKNKFVKIKILKEIIRKYSKKNYYIIFYIDDKIKYIENNLINKQNKYLALLVLENNKKNLLKLNKNYNKKINLIIINNKKNNLSKYFYQNILRNKFNKIIFI